MKFLGALQVPVLSAAPASPAAGQIYYNTAAATFYGWNGSAWVPLKSDGGNASTVDGKSASDFMPAGPISWNQLKGV